MLSKVCKDRLHALFFVVNYYRKKVTSEVSMARYSYGLWIRKDETAFGSISLSAIEG
jgi:hypothetical protein